jgi:hypothetical protein
MTTGAIASSSSQAYSSAAAAASAAAATNLPLPPLPPPKYSSSTAASSSSKAMSYQHEIEDLQGSLFVAAETIKDTEKKLKKLQATCFKLTKLTEEQAEQIRTLQLQAPHFQTVRDQNKCEDIVKAASIKMHSHTFNMSDATRENLQAILFATVNQVMESGVIPATAAAAAGDSSKRGRSRSLSPARPYFKAEAVAAAAAVEEEQKEEGEVSRRSPTPSRDAAYYPTSPPRRSSTPPRNTVYRSASLSRHSPTPPPPSSRGPVYRSNTTTPPRSRSRSPVFSSRNHQHQHQQQQPQHQQQSQQQTSSRSRSRSPRRSTARRSSRSRSRSRDSMRDNRQRNYPSSQARVLHRAPHVKRLPVMGGNGDPRAFICLEHFMNQPDGCTNGHCDKSHSVADLKLKPLELMEKLDGIQRRRRGFTGNGWKEHFAL